MDKLPALGRDVVGSAPVTFQAFGDLLRRPERLALLNRIPREVHRYGDHERQTLDFYRSSSSPGQVRPIFVFLHGGANVSGGSIAPDIPGEVVYKGLAYFLTQDMGVRRRHHELSASTARCRVQKAADKISTSRADGLRKISALKVRNSRTCSSWAPRLVVRI